MKRKVYMFMILIATLIFLFAPTITNADTISYELFYEFSGGQQPSGSIIATFDDSYGDANTVRLTMSATNLTDKEFISKWYFNFDDSLDVTKLNFDLVSSLSDTVKVNKIKTGKNAYKADGDGKYDILFDFAPPPGKFKKKFTAGETLVYDITYIYPISASSFNYFSDPAGGHGPFTTAAHIQGIAPNDGSGWVAPIPEPSTILLVGFGLIGVVGYSRRRLSKKH